MAREESRLDVREEAQRDLPIKQVMREHVLFALLVGMKQEAATIVGERDLPAQSGLEMFSLKLLAIEEGESEPIGDDGPELLHQVEGEGGAARAECVQEADLWIQANALKGGLALRAQQCVQKREDGIRGVARGVFCSSSRGESTSIDPDQAWHRGKVGAGGLALGAASLIERLRTSQPLKRCGEAISRLSKLCCVFDAGRFASAAEQNLAAVLDLAGNHLASDGHGARIIRESEVLRASEEHVAAHASFDAGAEPAPPIEPDDALPVFGEAFQRGRRDGDATDHDECRDRQERESQPHLAVNIHAYSVVVEPDDGAWSDNEQCVQELVQ